MLLVDPASTKFTFQYGSTLIDVYTSDKIYHFEFTFQYGSTLINIILFIVLVDPTFTFQYGSTLIIKLDKNKATNH